MCDDVTASTVRRAWWAREHNGGHPSAAWSTREQLAVALVLSDRQHLDGLGYTAADAARSVRDGMADPPRDIVAWIKDIRAAVTVAARDLPTWNDIVDHARASVDAARTAVSDARDWLISDWRPVTAPLSDGAVDARIEVVRIVGEITNVIDQAKDALRHAENDTGDTTGQRDTGGMPSRRLSVVETPDLS